MSLNIPNPSLPTGSTIVLTGANGYIASHIANQLLLQGHHVRGTVRSPSKTAWLATHFDKTYGPGRFTLHEVADVEKDGAFDNVVNAIMNFSPNDPTPEETITSNVNATLSILRSAARAAAPSPDKPGVKRFIYTSSSGAAAMPRPGEPYTVDATSYNHQAVAIALSGKGPKGMAGGYITYSAAKTRAELELWKWYEEEKPGFVLNSIVPNAALGKVLLPEHQGFPTAVGAMRPLWQGKVTPEFVAMFPAQWYCDVIDIARIHIAALLLPDVQSERLIAYADKFNINDLLAVFRQIQPNRTFPDDLPDLPSDKGTIANERATQLMERLQGAKGWISLKDCLAPLAEQYAAAEAESK
ncbi:aldehyde reductase II [Colletotrichum acutatum]|uniref:Aldehyde reductase II n=1 Tax=Glomerella acutata TaxID=27357 RepID=A0AAD8USE5_GLOAC|nr:aldehyde reductase II [Colletotrichum acutatum]KAK1725560.1 aldehyde reductase II [Colletotrichum acutatum]